MKNRYIPDYQVAPGEVLEEYLESSGMSQAELAARTGLTRKTINEIIKGKSPITPESALKFERSLGRPAHFWNNLERQYQEDRVRIEEQLRLQSHLEWLKKIPVDVMAKFGWIQKFKDKTEQLEAVLQFFGIASPEQWETVWREYQVAYRQSKRYGTHAEAVSTWLRKGEIEARKISCNPFDRNRFIGVLEEIRGLTIKTPDTFVVRLQELCASGGVAVVFVPELPKTSVSGGTRWMGNQAIIQLSLRYKSNDHLWFTFFHEAGHILKHGRKDVFIEENGPDDRKEEEANVFARDTLIPPKGLRKFLERGKPSLIQITAFANEIGIAPGIVVGRLQHDGLIPRSMGNQLKIYYKWSDEKS